MRRQSILGTAGRSAFKAKRELGASSQLASPIRLAPNERAVGVMDIRQVLHLNVPHSPIHRRSNPGGGISPLPDRDFDRVSPPPGWDPEPLQQPPPTVAELLKPVGAPDRSTTMSPLSRAMHKQFTSAIKDPKAKLRLRAYTGEQNKTSVFQVAPEYNIGRATGDGHFRNVKGTALNAVRNPRAHRYGADELAQDAEKKLQLRDAVHNYGNKFSETNGAGERQQMRNASDLVAQIAQSRDAAEGVAKPGERAVHVDPKATSTRQRFRRAVLKVTGSLFGMS